MGRTRRLKWLGLAIVAIMLSVGAYWWHEVRVSYQPTTAILDLPNGFVGTVRVIEDPAVKQPATRNEKGWLRIAVPASGTVTLPTLKLPGFPGDAVARYEDGKTVPAATAIDNACTSSKVAVSWAFAGERTSDGARHPVLWFVIGSGEERCRFFEAIEAPDSQLRLHAGKFQRGDDGGL